jgi:alpha-L-rhamnosidase
MHPGFGATTLPIWQADDAEYFNGRKNGCVLFRKRFSLASSMARAEWRIFADTRYRAYVDGCLIGWGPSRCDHRLAQYDVYHMDLAAGEHLLAVIAMHYGYSTGANTSVHQMMIAELAGTAEDGSPLIIGTDTSWKSHPAKWLERTSVRASGTLGPIEICDERERMHGWETRGYDDSSWPVASAMYGSTESLPWFAFEARDIAMPRSGIIPASAVTASGFGSGMPCDDADLGKRLEPVEWAEGETLQFPLRVTGGEQKPAVLNISWDAIHCGFLLLDVSGGAGTVVDVFYAEALDGRLVAAFSPSLRRVCDRFILKEGTNHLEVVFGWKAFAHIQLWVFGDAEIRRAEIRTMEYPLPEAPVCSVAEPRADLLIDNCIRTLRLCAQDGLLDSPSREQQQWMGDGERQAGALFTLFRETALWRRLLKQIGQSVDWSGCLLPRYPGRHEHTAPIPSFMLSWIFSHEEYVLRTGDHSLLEEWWPQMVAVMRWFTRFERNDGLLHNVPYWSFIDWGEAPSGPSLDVSRGGMVTALNALYHGARSRMAGLAEMLGDSEGSAFYQVGESERAAALRAQSFLSERGAFCDCVVDGQPSNSVSEPTNLVMLEHAVLPSDEAEKVLRRVFLEPDGRVVRMSPYFHRNFGRVLARAGRARFAFDTMVARLAPSLEAGASTIWERYELFHRKEGSAEAFLSSASHAWGAMLPSFLVEEVLRLRCDDFDGTSFSINPLLEDFAEASIGFPTAFGPASIQWKTGPTAVHLAYDLPENIRVLLMPEGRDLAGCGEMELPCTSPPWGCYQ